MEKNLYINVIKEEEYYMCIQMLEDNLFLQTVHCT